MIRPDLSQYHVGWICAVEIEFTIACALLDDEYEPPSVPDHDQNVYTCGRIDKHNVVIACLPRGKYGTTSATSVALDMLRSFRFIRYGLVVGIAGGAPARRDIRLGDVVVGCPTGSYSGVINYQYGKKIQDELHLTGALAAPPRRLLAAVNKLISVHETEGHRFQETAEQLVAHKPRLRQRYDRPAPDRDRLYLASFIHPETEQTCDECCPHQGENLVRRVHRVPAREPVVHYGLIASADQLMKDARDRDALSKKLGVLCFEMEAAGLMDHFPCLVIRGICDYSDTHKNDEWQGYAALAAAIYATDLLQVLPVLTEEVVPPPSPGLSVAPIYGLFSLHKPSDEEKLLDIVAIHGLSGSAYASWTDRKQHLWLRDSLPQSVRQAGIWTYGYDSAKVFGGGWTRIADAASVLLDDLETIRRPGSRKHSNMLFICHDLGGVLLREALAQADRQTPQVFFETTSVGIAFLATPQQGLVADEWALLLKSMAVNILVGNSDRVPFLKNLPRLSRALSISTSDNFPFLQKTPILSFYEQETPSNVDQIVIPRAVAISGVPRERSIPLLQDHRGMSAFSRDSNLEARQTVCMALQDLAVEVQLDGLSQTQPDGPQPINTSSERSLRATLLRDLFCFDYESVLASIPKAASGTGAWLINNRRYQAWRTTNVPSILYLRGPPGYGKSVAAGELIHNFTAKTFSLHAQALHVDDVVAYFFFGKGASGLFSQVLMLRSLLHQLLQQRPSLAQVIDDSLRYTTTGRERTTVQPYNQPKALWKALKDALEAMTNTRTLIAIDALDEVQEEDAKSISKGLLEITRALQSVCTSQRVMICLTSRPNDAIISQFRENRNSQLNAGVILIDMQESEMAADISTFLQTSVTAFGRENDFPSTAVDDIQQAILEGAQGMFLWAHLAWEVFKHGTTLWSRREIQRRLKRLRELPPGLESLYQRLILKIEKTVQQTLQPLFICLLVAPRPLLCDEVGQMLGIRGDENTTKDLDVPFSVKATIERYCPMLFRISPDGVVEFIHLSLKEYLQKSLAEPVRQFYINVAAKCLHYLRLADIQAAAQLDVDSPDPRTCRAHSRRFKFHEYASKSLQFHMEHVPYDHDLWLSYAELAKESQTYHVVATHDHSRHMDVHNLRLSYPDYCILTPLRHALRLGALNLVERFASNGYNLDEKTFRHLAGSLSKRKSYVVQTALHAYIARAEVVSKLLENGANPNVCDHRGRTPLHLAAAGKHQATIRALLQSSLTDVNIQDCEGKTALHYEASISDDSLILADSRTDLQVSDKNGRSAMAYAACWGNSKMVAKMASNTKAVLSHSKNTLSPMVSAAQLGWEDSTVKMLQVITDVNAHRGYDGKTITHLAVINGWGDVLRLACRRGADVNVVDDRGKTPLHYAAELGEFTLARELLRQGATARTKDYSGYTAVHVAAAEGFADTILPLMLDSDYDVNAHDPHRRSVVHWAATCDYAKIIRTVVETPDVDLFKKDWDGRTALHTAALCGCPNVLRELLRLGAYDVTETDAFGNTLLHLAARGGSYSSLEVLLPYLDFHKHRINAHGQTALGTAQAYHASEEVLELLHKHGIRQQARLSPDRHKSFYSKALEPDLLVPTSMNAICLRKSEYRDDRESDPMNLDEDHPYNSHASDDYSSTRPSFASSHPENPSYRGANEARLRPERVSLPERRRAPY